MIRRATKRRFAAAALLAVGVVGWGPASESGQLELVPDGPADGAYAARARDWTAIFRSDGTVPPPSRLSGFGVVDAVFVEDRISGGEAIDFSALKPAPAPDRPFAYNGPVKAPHDLGNAYVLTRMEGVGLVLEVRIERLVGDHESASHIEIELNRDIVGVSSGHRIPIVGADGEIQPGYDLYWPFRGERTPGDFMVRFDLVGRTVRSVAFKVFERVDGVAGYRTLEAGENLGDEPCFDEEPFYSVCSDFLARNRSGPGVIANGDPEQPYAPDSYLEFSVNVGRLADMNPDFTAIQLRTPQDFSFGTFRASGHFANPAPDATTPQGLSDEE